MSSVHHFNEPEIRKLIRKFVTSNFPVAGNPNGIEDDDSLLELGVIDSTGVLELVGYIEETFSVRVEDEELVPENLDSLDNIVGFIASKTSDA